MTEDRPALREPGYGSFVSRPRDEDRETRKPLATWDRVKFLLLVVGLFFFFVWAEMADNPLIPFADAVDVTLEAKWWLLALGAIELLRQAHFLLAEHSKAYYRFWTVSVFGRFNAGADRLDPWNRYRLARVAKLVLAVVVLAIVLGAIYDEPPALALVELPARVYSALPIVLQFAMGAFFVIFQFAAIFWFLSRGGVDVYFPDDVKTRFADVWGQDAVLERVKENMVFLDDPESIEDKGGYVPGGILLWGPPGTGKTLMAEAVAGETGRPYVFVDPGAFINMFMGVGILKVKSLFRKLRKLALRYGGVIVFFDEADSLGNRGQLAPGGWGGQMTPTPFGHDPFHGLEWLSPETAGLLARMRMSSGVEAGPTRDRIIMAGMGGGGMGTLQALLTELSGLKKPRGFVNRHVRRALGMRPKPPPKYRILVMMATNMPQSLDEALLRPGRIDRIYKVGYPSKEGRVRTYRGYLDKVEHELTDEEVDRLATITPYATGASIKDLVNEALINAIRSDRPAIQWRDIVKAKQLKDLGPPEDVEYILRERHAVAVHEACHAVAAYRVRRHLTIDIATIEKGGNYLGMVASIPLEDQFTRWRTEYEADIVVSLASLAGEKLFFEGDNSSGVSGDLESATQLATLMEGYWGMGSTVASHGVTHRVGVGGGGRPGRPEGDDDKDLLDSTLGARIEENLVRLLEQAEALLRDNRAAVLAVAHALEANKTVTGDDIEAIIEGRPGPLLDGRPYHFDDVQAALEEYHTLARDAHRDHAAPAAPLPELPAVTPAQEWLESVTRDVGGNGHGEDAADDVGSAETVAIAIPRPESEGERGADQDSEEDWD
jgi:ATP-dependent Zn protease